MLKVRSKLENSRSERGANGWRPGWKHLVRVGKSNAWPSELAAVEGRWGDETGCKLVSRGADYRRGKKRKRRMFTRNKCKGRKKEWG